jgi:hypothetical protein
VDFESGGRITFSKARSNDSGLLFVPISFAVSRMRWARSASVIVVFLAGMAKPIPQISEARYGA